MTVQLIVGNIESRIVGNLPHEANNDLDDTLCYMSKGAEYSQAFKKGIWDGYTRLYKKSRQSYYTGLQSLVVEILQKHQIPFSKKDMRNRPEINMPNLKFTPPYKYTPRDYQQLTIEKAMQRTRGLLKIATGGGKTMITTELIGSIKTGPFMFYVLTKDLLDQAYDTLSSCLNTPIGKIGGGECNIQMINVCTIQTAIRSIYSNQKFDIKDYLFDEEDSQWWKEEEITSDEKSQMIKKLISSCKGLYFDECHHASAGTCKDVINASPNAFWKFGGSATPYREDGAELMIQALFGKKIIDINASYLIEKGFLVEPNIIFEPINSNMGLHSWKAIYKNSIAKNDSFNTHVAETAKFLMSNGFTTLILVGEIQQGKFLANLLPDIPFVCNKTDKDLRRKAIQDLRDKKIMGMIATSLADEGLDVPSLNAALLAGGGASATRVHQRIGRTLRLDHENKNKKSLVIYYEHDARYLSKHATKVKKILKEESKFNIIKSAGKEMINNEIESLLGLECKNNSLFD